MKRAPLIKTLTILFAGLVSFWLTIKPAALPTSPINEGVEATSLDLHYDTSDPTVVIDEILSRPLFLSTRRPVPTSGNDKPSSANSVNPVVLSLDDITLFGITISANNRAGLVKRIGDKDVRVIHEGDTMDGWLVEHIQNNSIIFSNGNNRSEHLLHKKLLHTTAGQ